MVRGCFHGKRRKVMQQKMIASDQISVGRGSYFFSSYTSGARYGSEPTIPVSAISQDHSHRKTRYIPEAGTMSFSKG